MSLLKAVRKTERFKPGGTWKSEVGEESMYFASLKMKGPCEKKVQIG